MDVHDDERAAPVPPASACWPARWTSRSTRQPQLAALLRLARRSSPLQVAERVDLDARGAVLAAQEAVVLRTRCRTGRRGRPAATPLIALLLSSLPLTSPTVPNRWAPIWWWGTAQEDPLDGHAGKLVLVLEDVGDHVVGHVLLDGRGRERQRLQLRRSPPLRCAAACIASMRAEPAVERRALVRRRFGSLSGRHLDRQADAVVDQHAAVAVDDLAARRLDLDLAHAVVVRLAPGTCRRTAPAGTRAGRR